MRNPPLPGRWAPIRRRHIFALAAIALLGGCANADFGEVRPTLVSDGIHDWVGPYASATRRASSFELTDDERALRDLGYPLIEEPYDRQQWYSVAGEYGVIRPNRGPAFDRTAYANRLLEVPDRSPSARYSPLNDDVRNDIARSRNSSKPPGAWLTLTRSGERAWHMSPPCHRPSGKTPSCACAKMHRLLHWSAKS